jgi:mono/diheme cytochrome c family protein
VRPTPSLRIAALLAAAVSLAGCERVMRDMYEQPKKLPATASPLFGDGMASRPPPPGSVAHSKGDLAATSSGRRGDAAVRVELEAGKADSVPAQPSQDLLLRGQERYDIYCLPCHSAVGDGDGPVVRRGFPAPPSYHQPRLIAAPDRHFYDVISHGYGVMFSYADRVAPADRWAIVAYIRALQLSQHAPVASLPAALRESLIAAKSEGVKAPPTESASAPAKAPR